MSLTAKDTSIQASLRRGTLLASIVARLKESVLQKLAVVQNLTLPTRPEMFSRLSSPDLADEDHHKCSGREQQRHPELYFFTIGVTLMHTSQISRNLRPPIELKLSTSLT